MARFSTQNPVPKNERQSNHIHCIFYGKASDSEFQLFEESIKQIRKEYRDSFSFHYQAFPGVNAESELAKGFDLKNSYLPAPGVKSEMTLFMPFTGLKSRVNFNLFFQQDNLNPSTGTSYSRLFFKEQALTSHSCFILGKDLADYICHLPFEHGLAFENQLLWYLEKLNCEKKAIILDQSDPYSPKKIKITFHPLAPLRKLKRSFQWNFILPLKEYKTGKTFNPGKESPLWRIAFFATALLIFILLPILSFQSGISGDEEKHHLHAEKVYNYFTSDGLDSLALNDPKNKLHYYGQSFDLFAFAFIKTFNIEKVYEARHVLNGITGALAILTTGILIRFLAGSFSGFLTLLFMFFFPRFMGHAMNNPMDIPFALGYIFSIYHMIRFLKKLPEFSLKHAIFLSLGIAFATSIRIGGLILIPYLFMFGGLYLILHPWPWKFLSTPYLRFAGKGLIYLSAISVVSYFLSILPWPYALQDPFNNPFKALGMMSNITVSLRVMFEGNIIWSDKLPWYYVPKNMYLTIPVVIMVSFIIPVMNFFRKKPETGHFWKFALYFVTIFPVLYIIYKESNVYGGWRHTMFIYPGFAGLAAIGIYLLKNLFSSRIYRTAVILLIIAALIHPISHIFRNYPLQYIYFNEIAGGVNKAFKKYETDYYLNSLKPGTEWILENIVKKDTLTSKLTIASNAPYDIMDYYFKDHRDIIDFPYTRYYDRGAKDWDYAIFYCNYIDPYQLRKNIWPPKNTIHEIMVDDVVVCAIVERKNRNDFLGIKHLDSGLGSGNLEDINLGLRLLESAVSYDKNNEIAHLSLARGYIMMRDFDRARNTLNSLLEIYPDYDKALNMIAFSFISEGDLTQNQVLVDRAIALLDKVISINNKFVDGYYNMGLAWYMKGEDNQALNYLYKAVDINGRHKRSYYLIANILENNGETARAQEITNYANSL